MVNDLEVVAEFEELAKLDDAVGDAVVDDVADRSVKDAKIEALLSSAECTLLNCSVKTKVGQLEAKLKAQKKRVFELTKDNEALRKSLDKGLSPEKRMEAATVAMKDDLVQALKDERDKALNEIKARESLVLHYKSRVEVLDNQVKDYMRVLQTDAALYEKYNKMKFLEERCAKMDAWLREAQAESRKIEVNRDKLKDEVVGLLRLKDGAKKEYEETRELIAHADALLRKGCVVTPPPNRRKPFFRNPFKKAPPLSDAPEFPASVPLNHG